MASAIIYLAIIGMWVAYFLPRWIHTHDEFSGKSVERYKSALRVVAGDQESAYSLAMHTDLDAPYKKSKTLMRRRIIFLLIFSSLVVASIGAIIGALNWLAIAIPVSGFVVYLAHTRRTINRERIQRRRIEGLQRSTQGVSHVNLSEVVAPKSDSELWVPLAEREITGIVLLPQGSAATRNTWTPNSIPAHFASCLPRSPRHRVPQTNRLSHEGADVRGIGEYQLIRGSEILGTRGLWLPRRCPLEVTM